MLYDLPRTPAYRYLVFPCHNSLRSRPIGSERTGRASLRVMALGSNGAGKNGTRETDKLRAIEAQHRNEVEVHVTPVGD